MAHRPTAQDFHEKPLVHRLAVDPTKLYRAWQDVIADDEFGSCTDMVVRGDLDGYAYIAVWDESLEEARPELNNLRQVVLRLVNEPNLRTYICQQADGSYILESHI